MKMAVFSLVLIIPIAFIFGYLARGEDSYQPIVVASQDGRHYFKMIPDKDDPTDYNNKGSGQMYKVSAKDNDEIMWRIKGWFSEKLYVYDESYLIRIGYKERFPSKDHFALGIYENGKSIREFSVGDFNVAGKEIDYSVGRDGYFKKVLGFADKHKFRVLTNQDYEFTIEIWNGKITEKKYVGIKE